MDSETVSEEREKKEMWRGLMINSHKQVGEKSSRVDTERGGERFTDNTQTYRTRVLSLLQIIITNAVPTRISEWTQCTDQR